MIRTTGLKRSAAFFMAVVLTALCFTVFLHSPRVYAEGEDDAKQAQETAQTVIEEYELSGKNVGVQIGTIGEREVYPYEESSRSRVEHFYTSADAVKALTEKQVECIVLDEKTMNALAQVRIYVFVSFYKNYHRFLSLFFILRQYSLYACSFLFSPGS